MILIPRIIQTRILNENSHLNRQSPHTDIPSKKYKYLRKTLKMILWWKIYQFLTPDRDNPTRLHIESEKRSSRWSDRNVSTCTFLYYVLLGPKLNVKMNKTN